MTNPISQAAIDAVAETYEQIADEDHEYRDLIGIDWTIIRDGLEAAMPHIRTAIVEEIRLTDLDSATFNQTARDYSVDYANGYATAIEHAARIAEGENK